MNHLDTYNISFDIFKAYEKTTIEFVTRVMRKMGFGPGFKSWVETCHKEITTYFILGKLTRELAVAISSGQGDLAAMPLFLDQHGASLELYQTKYSGDSNWSSEIRN